MTLSSFSLPSLFIQYPFNPLILILHQSTHSSAMDQRVEVDVRCIPPILIHSFPTHSSLPPFTSTTTTTNTNTIDDMTFLPFPFHASIFVRMRRTGWMMDDIQVMILARMDTKEEGKRMGLLMIVHSLQVVIYCH